MSNKKQKYYSSTQYSSTHSNQSYNNQKNRNKYKQKPEILLKFTTQYIPMIPEDVLYRQSLTHLSSKQYMLSLQKIVTDLNALLYFNQDDFFQQLQQSQSLRSCLQSCLTCLAKNSYYNLSPTRILAINRQQLQYPKERFNYYEKLHEVILKIYHRISNATKKEHKQIVYDCWLMDVPKMIDLAMVYCVRVSEDVEKYGNLNIVKGIIGKAIETNPKQYEKDFDDFINILYQDKLPLIHQDIQHVINLQQQAMHYAKINFANPQRSFLITSQKILFEIKDIFTIVSYIYTCFPQGYKQKLATDHEVLEDMIKIFVQFVQSTKMWKTGKHKEKFQINFQAIHQSCCENFYQNFVILEDIISKGDSLANHFYSRALNSYCVHSMYFISPKINKEHQKLYQQMIKTIVYRLQHQRQMFFLSQAPPNLKLIKLSEDEKVAIKKSHLKMNQIYDQIEEIIQSEEISKRIKRKINNFLDSVQKVNKNNWLGEQNRMIFGEKTRQKLLQRRKYQEIEKERKRQKQKQKQRLLQQQKAKQQQQQQILNDKEFGFSILNESEQKQQSDQQQYMNLSFSALAENESSQEYDEQLSFEIQSLAKLQTQIQTDKSNVNNFTLKLSVNNNVLRKQIIELADPELYSQLEENQNQMQTVYKQSTKLLYDDDYQQLREERQEYYKSHKPEYGHYMDRLIERGITRVQNPNYCAESVNLK